MVIYNVLMNLTPLGACVFCLWHKYVAQERKKKHVWTLVKYIARDEMAFNEQHKHIFLWEMI